MKVSEERPLAEWLTNLRERYPCEPEVDRFLSAKMSERSGSGYSPIPLNILSASVEKLLDARLDEPFAITSPRWLTGGASKLQMAFILNWQSPQAPRTETPMVLRMQPAESIVESSRLREFQLLKAIADVLPVPPAYWVDDAAEFLPYPGMIYGLVDGVTKPTSGVGGEVSGMGTNFGSRLRERLAPQFVQHLAAIHTYDWQDAELSAFEIPSAGTLAAERQLNWWARVCEEDKLADIPLLKLAEQWLRANLPSADQICLVHGDFRCGNFLFNETDGEITAWLDWELGHFGDRHEDLAWCTARTWGHPHEDTGTDLICGLMPEDVFIRRYESISKLTVDQERLRYYKILNTWKLAVMSLVTSYRVARGSKTHQDILVAWCLGVGAKFTEQLCEILEEVI